MKYFITVSRTDLDGFGQDCGVVGYDNKSTDCYESYLFFDSRADAEAWKNSPAAKEWGDDAEFDICADDYYTFVENVAEELFAFCEGRGSPSPLCFTKAELKMFEDCEEEYADGEDEAVIKKWAEKIAESVKND